MQKKILIVLGIILLLLAGIFGLMKFKDIFNTNTGSSTEQSQSQLSPDKEETEPEASFNKAKYPLDQPGSDWWVVNKTRPLPPGYEPADLLIPDVKRRLSGVEQMQISSKVEPALKEMFDRASAEGVILVFGSGYRSEALQRQFYNTYVAQDGQASADRLSARPGTSEHQTGLAFDATSTSQTCHLETCFENTPEGRWLIDNSYKFGFIIRYPKDKENITGYSYEPWHLRYVGKELANEMHKTSILTLEEFFELPAAPDYL